MKDMKTLPYMTQSLCPPPQYSIYAYNQYSEGEIGKNKWIKLQSDTNKTLIFDEAKKLYESEKFDKIEVKQKLFDRRKQRNQMKTVHILGRNPQKKLYKNMMVLVVMATLCALATVQIL